MTTIEDVATECALIKDRLVRGEKVTKGELKLLQSFVSLYSKTAFTADHRKVQKTGK
jgi:uncharacterized coiled-coil DUF342 family protein